MYEGHSASTSINNWYPIALKPGLYVPISSDDAPSSLVILPSALLRTFIFIRSCSCVKEILLYFSVKLSFEHIRFTQDQSNFILRTCGKKELTLFFFLEGIKASWRTARTVCWQKRWVNIRTNQSNNKRMSGRKGDRAENEVRTANFYLYIYECMCW